MTGTARFTGAAAEGFSPAPTKEDGVSPSPSPEYSDPVHIAMFRDILRAAGFRGVAVEVSSDAKRQAMVFLISEFRKGKRTRTALLFALEHRVVAPALLHPPETRSKNEAADIWQNGGDR